MGNNLSTNFITITAALNFIELNIDFLKKKNNEMI